MSRSNWYAEVCCSAAALDFADSCRMRFLRIKQTSLIFDEKLERAKGFEPSTPTLARSCSTPELHPHPWDTAEASADIHSYAKPGPPLQPWAGHRLHVGSIAAAFKPAKSSCPALCRASTSLLLHQKGNVDGRAQPDHDDGLNQSSPASAPSRATPGA